MSPDSCSSFAILGPVLLRGSRRIGVTFESAQGCLAPPLFQSQWGWSDPRICISNKFSGEAVGPANTLGNQLISSLFKHHCLSYKIFQASRVSSWCHVAFCVLSGWGLESSCEFTEPWDTRSGLINHPRLFLLLLLLGNVSISVCEVLF